jgi:putative DNA primase/helicase
VIASLQDLATLLGGHVDGDRALCPGPNHSSGDRSLVVTPAQNANGFKVSSFALDDPATCISYVKARLGGDLTALAELPARNRADEDKRRAERIARAMEIWDESVSPIGTPVESYLWGIRHLDLPEDVAGAVVRYHPRCWWSDELTKKPFQARAMVCAMRNIRTDEIVAVQRTRLDLVEREGALVGVKRDRRMLGAASGAAIKFDADDAVVGGLVIGEGLETCLTGRFFGLRPIWALGSAGAIGAFPILPGVECLTILAEHDDANAKATHACAARWHAAGREVLINRPIGGKDLNDSWRAPNE